MHKFIKYPGLNVQGNPLPIIDDGKIYLLADQLTRKLDMAAGFRIA